MKKYTNDLPSEVDINTRKKELENFITFINSLHAQIVKLRFLKSCRSPLITAFNMFL